MKTAREIHKGNKNRLNLPLHKLFGWLVRLLLSGFCWSLYGGSLLVSILSFAVVVGIIIWLLIL